MVSIPHDIIRQIERHGERTYPEECCGIMLGADRDGIHTVLSIVEIDNSIDVNRQRRFLVTPAQYRDSERIAAERRLELLGFYHSHPDHPAIPSAFDTEHALPWFTYVIVSIMQGQAKNITAWLLSEDRSHFDERILSLADTLTQVNQ